MAHKRVRIFSRPCSGTRLSMRSSVSIERQCQGLQINKMAHLSSWTPQCTAWTSHIMILAGGSSLTIDIIVVGWTSNSALVYKGGHHVYRAIAIHINHAIAQLNFGNQRFQRLLLPLLQRGRNADRRILAGQLTCCHASTFDEGINCQYEDNYYKNKGFTFCSGILT